MVERLERLAGMVRSFCHTNHKILTPSPYVIQLDNTHSGRQLLGSERSFDIELDRNTEFLDPVVAPATAPAKAGGKEKIGEVVDLALGDTEAKEAGKEEDPMEKMLFEGTERYPVVRGGLNRAFVIRNAFILSESMAYSRTILLDVYFYVYSLMILYSGPSRSDSSSELPYICAPSVKAYLDWNIGHRKAVEVNFPIFTFFLKQRNSFTF